MAELNARRNGIKRMRGCHASVYAVVPSHSLYRTPFRTLSQFTKLILSQIPFFNGIDDLIFVLFQG